MENSNFEQNSDHGKTNAPNRRDFIKKAGATALGMYAAPFFLSGANSESSVTEQGQAIPSMKNNLEFPKGFLWGTATASYQVEGAVNEDGRGQTIWDTFSHQPGKIKNNDNGDTACDMYNKYKSDVQLMKSLDTKSYRFSIAWSRIFPEGTGTPNEKGLDFYNRLVDELLANGIQPFATLYHWDLPQALQDKYKGWVSQETSKAFADYAAYVAEKLSDRVKHFFTINEFKTYIDWGLGTGGMAPGIKLSTAELNQARHNSVLAHGLAVQAIRAKGKSGTKVGPAENVSIAIPISETPENIKAAELAMRELNAGYMTVIIEGKYTDAFLKAAGADAPKYTAEEMKIISTPVDFLGLNVYMPTNYVKAAGNAEGYELIPLAESSPKTTSSWHVIGPESLYWAPRYAQKLWNAKEIYVTENGCSSVDKVIDNDQIQDTDRIMFIRNYLTQLQRATSEGIPVKGYFYWSLMDNFEWNSGYDIRFGLYYTDYNTLYRLPKLSAGYYKSVASNNRVM